MKNKKKNVFWMGITSLFNDISSEMIFPLLPIFLSSVLNANMAILGVIEGVAESTASILKAVSGWLSDRFRKRKVFVWIGYGLSAVVKPILALATIWQHVLIVRVADRVGKGIRTSPRDALIASSSIRKKRGAAFGLHRMMDTLGAVIGTLLASFLLYLAFSYRAIFWLALIPALIAVVAIAFVKEVPPPKRVKPLKISFKMFDSSYKRFILVSVLFSIANFSYAFFLLRARDLGIVIALIPIVYLLYNIVYAAVSIPAGKLSDKIGSRNVIGMGYFLFAVVCLGFAFADASIYAWLLLALYGVFMATVQTVSRAYVSNMVQSSKRATAIGIYHTFTGFAILPASIIGGILWNSFSASAAFIYGAVVSAIAGILLFTLLRK